MANFTASQLAARVRALGKQKGIGYNVRHAAYALKKLCDLRMMAIKPASDRLMPLDSAELHRMADGNLHFPEVRAVRKRTTRRRGRLRWSIAAPHGLPEMAYSKARRATAKVGANMNRKVARSIIVEKKSAFDVVSPSLLNGKPTTYNFCSTDDMGEHVGDIIYAMFSRRL